MKNRILVVFNEGPNNLKDIFADWDKTDDDLKEQYCEDVEWILDLIMKNIEDAEVANSIEAWVEIKIPLKEIMGLDLPWE